MAEIKLNEQNFSAEVLCADKPVLVDFWADWCGPCRMLAPTVAQLAEEYEGVILVGKVNVDESMELAQRYGIASIPTLILFWNGKPVNQIVGFVPREEIVRMLEESGSV